MVGHSVYRITWTEFERGWGQRPDGATLHATEQDAVDFVNRHYAREQANNPSGVVPDDYTRPDRNPRTDKLPTVLVSPEIYQQVLTHGSIWEPRGDVSEAVPATVKCRECKDTGYCDGGRCWSCDAAGPRGTLTSGTDMGPQYACGHYPMVGDLIEFGTRHKRMLVTAIDDDGPQFALHAGSTEYLPTSVALMVLIARHGEEVKPTYTTMGA